MSHEVESMFSVGERPWHGLGHVLESAPSCAEALVLAGLNWGVELRPLATTVADGGVSIGVESHRAVMRMDTGAVLGVVGEDFRPFGNADAFAFFEPLVGEGLITLETAGSLRAGRRVSLLAACDTAGARPYSPPPIAPVPEDSTGGSSTGDPARLDLGTHEPIPDLPAETGSTGEPGVPTTGAGESTESTGTSTGEDSSSGSSGRARRAPGSRARRRARARARLDPRSAATACASRASARPAGPGPAGGRTAFAGRTAASTRSASRRSTARARPGRPRSKTSAPRTRSPRARRPRQAARARTRTATRRCSTCGSRSADEPSGPPRETAGRFGG
jgi:hypothetical protein